MSPRLMTAVDVVVGAGHNGLVAACYLAQQGRERPGGTRIVVRLPLGLNHGSTGNTGTT